MDRYAFLLLSMSLQDAKAILGLPADVQPTPAAIKDAWKAKAFENHPDRGGDAAKMVEINVAKDILEGKHDEVPEQAFYMVGHIEDVFKKAQRLREESA